MPPSSSHTPLEDVIEPFQSDEDGLTFDVVPDYETVARNDPNGEFINLRDEDDDLVDGVGFHDESELDEDGDNEDQEAYETSDSE